MSERKFICKMIRYYPISTIVKQRLFLIGIFLFVSCTENKPNPENSPPLATQEKKVFHAGLVSADNEFDGARLNDFKKLNDSTYQAIISPENTPVNNSPWFSFRIWAEEETNITLEIAYTDDYTNRYIPKLSTDGMIWESCEKNLYEQDTVNGTLRMNLALTSQKLWVSSQENLNSQYIQAWVDSLSKKAFINQDQIGESVLGQPIPMLRIKEGDSKYAMIIIGRQHPPEVPGGTISLMSFVQALLSDSDLAITFREKFDILVFPLLNPDGVEQGNWRHNANGADLNRDWTSFSQPETRAVRDWLTDSLNMASGTKYCFGIDFHTSHSGPYLLTLDTIPHRVKPEITNEWIAQIETTSNQQLDIRPRAQSLPYCYNWMINELGIEAVTYEEGDEIDRKIVKERAKDYANILMKVLLDRYDCSLPLPATITIQDK